ASILQNPAARNEKYPRSVGGKQLMLQPGDSNSIEDGLLTRPVRNDRILSAEQGHSAGSRLPDRFKIRKRAHGAHV
ncbi:MAG: hypothetical protein ACI92S_000826, partial [Planctomycetaceae bacterium]